MGEGILRVWRDWLAERAEGAQCGETNEGDLSTEILWADSKKTVGLRVTVVEREAHPVGPPYRVGEERDVSYCLFYEGIFPMKRAGSWLISNRVACKINEAIAHR